MVVTFDLGMLTFDLGMLIFDLCSLDRTGSVFALPIVSHFELEGKNLEP